MEPRVGNKFRLGRKIGGGSFGEIYLGILFILIHLSFVVSVTAMIIEVFVLTWFLGTNIQTNEEVAIKLVSNSYSKSGTLSFSVFN